MSKVDAIKARLAALTADGNWRVTNWHPVPDVRAASWVCAGVDDVAIPDSDADCQFIAAAPADMRYLLSIADALAKLDADSLSPIEALTKLYELKRLVGKP